ncbi:MAG: hypothetical protein M3Z92_11145 [Bacteroidota bacterium]|nr:hypothetical protein [Bacteroidota bacterium]
MQARIFIKKNIIIYNIIFQLEVGAFQVVALGSKVANLGTWCFQPKTNLLKVGNLATICNAPLEVYRASFGLNFISQTTYHKAGLTLWQHQKWIWENIVKI